MAVGFLEIDLFAQDEEQHDTSGHERSSWFVSISANEQESTCSRIRLQDPFDEEQRGQSRWYVEEFVCKSPYSVTKARKAANALKKYAHSLLNQLGLVKLVKDAPSSQSHGNRRVTISISEDDGVENSIHQLHWELLEDPSLWDTDVEVIVKRTVISKYNGRRTVSQEVALDKERISALPKVNGLLVVARDLSQDSEKHDDVSPHLALGVLAQIQEELQRSGLQACLNLEVVRPGSLEALENHLKQASETHGNGYYHFAHFDVHGIVESKEGTAYLLFNDPDPDLRTTRQESAQKVAEILGNYGVSVAVLNACESARADSGNASNIAKMFIRSGIQNVLAMSFRISSSAVELLLRAFYHSLFLQGDTFSHAARRARDVLRRHPLRQARLGLQRSLADSFVPVVYSAGHDSSFTPGMRQSIGQSFDASDFALRMVQLAGKQDKQLIGREFDLLRLERQLLARGRIHLSGRAGVGKSALLRYATRIWRQSSFVDVVLFVDFAKVRSLADAVGSLVSQIPLPMLERITLQAKLRVMITTPTFDFAMFAEVLLKACSKPRLLIILDGLHTFSPNFLYSMPNGPSNEAFPMISRFIEALVNLSDARTPHIYHVLVTRFTSYLDTSTLPSTGILQQELKQFHKFRLPSLRLSDAVELSQLVLRDAGVNVDDWLDPDLNELELLLGLLDGNPSAILQILPQMPQTGVPFREFRTLVQDGFLLISSGGPGLDMVEEINSLFCQLHDESLALLLLLSAYWNEAGGINSLLDWTLSNHICRKSEIGLALLSTLQRGLIDIGPDVQEQSAQSAELTDIIITWIHPLLTICGRRTVYEILTKKQAHGSHLKLPSVRNAHDSLSSPLQSLNSSTTSQVVAAALVLSIVGPRANEIMLSEETREMREDFKTSFLRFVSTCDMQRILVTWVTGFSYQQLHSFWSSQAGNLATCLSICTRKPYLPIDQWPLDYFELHVANIRLVGSPAQVAEFAKSFEQLLEIFIDINGSLAIPPPHQAFALKMVTGLTAIYKCEVSLPAKSEKYVHIALRIVAESQDRFGQFEVPAVLYLKGLVLRYQAHHLLFNNQHEQAVEIWKTSLDIDNSIFENPHSLGTQWSPDQIQALANKLSTNETDIEAVAERLRALSSNSLLEAFYKSRKSSLRFIQTVASAQDKGEEFKQSKQFRSVLAQRGNGLEQIFEGARSMGFEGINQDPRWWPENFDMNRFHRKLNQPEERLAALESALSIGNTAEACEQLVALHVEALKNLDFDDAGEYVSTLMRYSSEDLLPRWDSADWDKRKEIYTLISTIVEILSGTSTNRKSSRDVLADAGEKLIRLLEEKNEPCETIRSLQISLEIWLKGSHRQHTTDDGDRGQAGKLLLGNMQRSVSLVIGRLRDKKFMQKLPTISLQFTLNMQRLQEAELKEDYDLALERLGVLEEFCRQPGNESCAAHTGSDWCLSKRLQYQLMRVSAPVIEQQLAAIARRDYDEARRIVQTFENDLSPELRQHASTTIAKWMAIIESMPLEFAISDMKQLRRSGKIAEAMQAAHDLVRTVDEGSFQYLDRQQLKKYSFVPNMTQLEVNCLIALHSSSCEEASRLIKEMHRLCSSNLDLAPSNYEDEIQDLEECCLFLNHYAGLDAAARKYDAAEYERHAKGFKTLYERQKRAPHIKRTLAATIDHHSLVHMDRWLLVLRLGHFVKRVLNSQVARWLYPVLGLHFAYKLRFLLLYLLCLFISFSLSLKSRVGTSVFCMVILYSIAKVFFSTLWCSTLLFVYIIPAGLNILLRRRYEDSGFRTDEERRTASV